MFGPPGGNNVVRGSPLSWFGLGRFLQKATSPVQREFFINPRNKNQQDRCQGLGEFKARANASKARVFHLNFITSRRAVSHLISLPPRRFVPPCGSHSGWGGEAALDILGSGAAFFLSCDSPPAPYNSPAWFRKHRLSVRPGAIQSRRSPLLLPGNRPGGTIWIGSAS
jgi:hypothetical protein